MLVGSTKDPKCIHVDSLRRYFRTWVFLFSEMKTHSGIFFFGNFMHVFKLFCSGQDLVYGVKDCVSYFVTIDCRCQEQGQDGNEEATENQ